MPMFYFDIVQIDGILKHDEIGVEFCDAAAAQIEAKRCLAEMSAEAVNQDLSELRIEVRDADGNRLALRIAHFDNDEDAE